MTALAQLKEGLTDIWENISTGWNELRERTTAAITRFNPIHHTHGSNSLRALYNRTMRWGLLAAEVIEGKNDVIIRIEAPGMEGEEFDLAIVENELLVRGEKQFSTEHQDDQYHIMECAYGRFERRIPLPAAVDDSKARAKYKRGVLTVTLPKTKSARFRKIRVRGND